MQSFQQKQKTSHQVDRQAYLIGDFVYGLILLWFQVRILIWLFI